MNIEELFNAEIYHNYGLCTTEYLKTKVTEYVVELENRITKLERLLADAARFIAYAQSKGVHGGEAIAKEIEENLNQGKP